ncbi:MAG: hypothetical protein WC478_05620 [Candidatus Omnitrophota bacterium]
MKRGRGKSELDGPHAAQIATMLEEKKPKKEIKAFMEETYGLVIQNSDISRIKKALKTGQDLCVEPRAGCATRSGRRSRPASLHKINVLPAAGAKASCTEDPLVIGINQDIASGLQALRESYHRSFLRIRASVDGECAAHGVSYIKRCPEKQ